MDKKSRILLLVLLALTVLSIGAAFEKIVISQDFTIIENKES